MSDDKKPKGNWRLLLVGVVLGSVITVGAFWITPLDFNKAKNSVIHTVKNINWGFGESKVITTATEKNPQGQITKTTKSEQPQSGKTIWNVLELSSRLAVPILLAVFGYQVQKRDKEKAEDQAELEREIAQNNLAEEAIQKYLDNMAKLLLDEEYRKELFPNVNDKLNPGCNNPVRNVARTQTTIILRRLEGYKEHQDRIIHFLRDTKLYGFIFENANLSGIDLQLAILEDVNLKGARLRNANLRGAWLQNANLQEADLRNANLQGGRLRDADFKEADLRNANLQEADLLGANLQGAWLQNANLQKANLLGANLKQANLVKAKLNSKQIKSTCNWEQAVYKGKWSWWVNCETWDPKNKQAKEDNTNYIGKLKKDESSYPKEQPDCSRWSR